MNRIKILDHSQFLTRLLPLYRVILHNDEVHEFFWVIETLLHNVSSLTRPKAYDITWTAHTTGRAVVIICPKETAEYYQER